eukprot:CAMPEP_0197193788 /NCGR_PEP_ID=MMETSP1423-20130617/27998_1 /TAXON_ID=476441 /ORGANISM="Pseudo-nitzschia heimii, Strain UNC1101" /LENGTH=353 /DNA_ID=CAMNT_0042647081 /DNA_START=688 /DNA_END=1748 /DNA_ORIENTATION=-
MTGRMDQMKREEALVNIPDVISAGGAQSPTYGRRLVGRFSWPIGRDPKGISPDYPLAVTRIVITIATCYLTWFAQAEYSNVMASSALTLICSMVFDKRLGQAAFCGSFAGMCSMAIIPTKNLALILGLVTSMCHELFIHFGNAFLGVGGRLGTTAFVATSAVAYRTGIPTGLGKYAFAGGSKALKLSALKWDSTLLPWALWHAVGSVATIILREISDDSAAADPVRASAVVGMAGALLLHHDKAAALAVYGGSFTGMSLPSKLMSLEVSSRRLTISNVLALLLTFAVAGAVGGIIHGATINWKIWPGGWGGKAGFCALLGCLTYRMMSEILAKMFGLDRATGRARTYPLKPDN